MSDEFLLGLLAIGAAIGAGGVIVVTRSRLGGWQRVAVASVTFLVGAIAPIAVALAVVAYRNITDPAPNVFVQPSPTKSGTRQ